MRNCRRKGTVGRSAGIAGLCVLALCPAGAFAATANTRIKRVFYEAGPAEVNQVTISLSGENYLVSDPGVTVTAQPACVAAGVTVTCPAAGITGMTVSAGDGADSITNATSTPSTQSGGDGHDSLQGGSGNDTLRGNKGVDTHAGGAGDDYIDVRGDRGDVVSCGSGNDTVMGDIADSIAADCETVDRGSVPVPGAPGATPGPLPRPKPYSGLGRHARWIPAPARGTSWAAGRTIACPAPRSGTTCSVCRETTFSRDCAAMTASSVASDRTVSRARRATTGCSGTTRGAASEAGTGSTETPATTG